MQNLMLPQAYSNPFTSIRWEVEHSQGGKQSYIGKRGRVLDELRTSDPEKWPRKHSYVIVFYLTNFFSTVNRLYQHVTGTSTYSLLLLQVIFHPQVELILSCENVHKRNSHRALCMIRGSICYSLQGLFNFLVYRRHYFMRLRQQNPTWSWRKLIVKAFQVSTFTRGENPATPKVFHPFFTRTCYRTVSNAFG